VKPFEIATEAQARNYLDEVAHTYKDFACKHGHYACAAWANGPCSDEVASEFNLGDEQ
jgi:hypothetical protein